MEIDSDIEEDPWKRVKLDVDAQEKIKFAKSEDVQKMHFLKMKKRKI